MDPFYRGDTDQPTADQIVEVEALDLEVLEKTRRAALEAQVAANGPQSATADAYNLAVVLVRGQKWTEGELLLRALLKDLQERETGRETSSFMYQEAGTMELLASCLAGLGREDEAQQVQGEAMELKQQAEQRSLSE